MSKVTPLRQQRKSETRNKLIAAAKELFEIQGYEFTTLEGIADRAGFHVQTLYRHFSSKIELAAAGDETQLVHFRDAIRDEYREGSTIAFWRQYLGGLAHRVTDKDDGRSYRHVLHYELESPTVSFLLTRLSQEYRDLFAESLEEDLDIEDPEERQNTARLIAITLWGAHEYVIARYDQEFGIDLATESLAMIDRVEQLFGHLLKDT